MNPATNKAASSKAETYPEKDALLAHQHAYQELASSIESTLSLIASKTEECKVLIAANPETEALFRKREDLLAQIASGEPLQKELEALDEKIRQAGEIGDADESKAYDMACAVAGLKRKAAANLKRLEEMRGQWQVLVRRFLLAEAEREAENYTQHAMALLSSYRKLRGLDHLRTQDKGVHPFTLVAGAGTLEVPSFDLEACKPYVDFTFKARLVTQQNVGYGATLAAAETLKASLTEGGVMVEPPPMIKPQVNLEPGEEALAQGAELE